MRILVTGSKGHIGTALCTKLRSLGHLVVGCDLTHDPLEYAFSHIRLPNGMERSYIRCDIADYRQLERTITIAAPDLIYNCAAEFGRWNGEEWYEQLWRSNVVGLRNILQLHANGRFFQLIHFSSSEVYGDTPELLHESITLRRPLHQLNDYALTKHVNEKQIINHLASYPSARIAVVRPFNLYGPGEYYSPFRSVNCRFTYYALHGMPINVFKGSRYFTYIDDAIDALCKLAENFKPQTYNIGGNNGSSILELAELAYRASSHKPNIIQEEEYEHQTARTKNISNSRAIVDLGYKDSVSLEEGMLRTYEWQESVYKPAK